MTKFLRDRGLLTLMILSSIAIGLYAAAFQLRLAGSPLFHARFDQIPIFTGMHVTGGAIVLLVGGLQFVPEIRQRYISFHRWTGRLYLSFVLIGGLGGLVMAPMSDGGLVAHFGFGTLAVLWLWSGAMAYLRVRQGNIVAHQVWMMRNYSMAFGAVTLRIYLGLFGVSGVSFQDSYPVVAWISWVPNLVLVEWYFVQKLIAAKPKVEAVQI